MTSLPGTTKLANSHSPTFVPTPAAHEVGERLRLLEQRLDTDVPLAA
jgi:hypothetical protein